MDKNEKQGKRIFGLSDAEYDDVRTLLRYAIAIFTAVGVALVIVALAAPVIRGML